MRCTSLAWKLCVSVSLATTKCHLGRVTLPNKFEHVSSDHQHRSMSLAEGSPGLMSRREGYPTWSILGGIPYHVTYTMMHLMLPTPSPHEQTDSCENITFQQNLFSLSLVWLEWVFTYVNWCLVSYFLVKISAHTKNSVGVSNWQKKGHVL